MVEIAVAAESIPPDWYYEDDLLVTLLDVLNRRAELMKRKK